MSSTYNQLDDLICDSELPKLKDILILTKLIEVTVVD